MSKSDRDRDYENSLLPMILTPRLEKWMRETGLTEVGARAILDYGRGELKKAMDDSAHPIMVLQSFVAAICAAFEGANFPPTERLDFLVQHFKLLDPVVREQIESFKPDKGGDGAKIQVH